MAGVYSSLSQSEKAVVVAVCKKLVELLKQARREGMLALEESTEGLLEAENWPVEVPQKIRRYLFILLRIMIEGVDIGELSMIAQSYKESSCTSSFETLCFTLVQIGVEEILENRNYGFMQEVFLSHIGLDCEDEFRRLSGFKEIWALND